MGLTKRHIRPSPIYSTPTWEDVHACIAAGADIIALDATERARPDGLPRTGIMCLARACTDALLMADVAQLHEGEAAAALSFDFVSTTLADYPETSPPRQGPDLDRPSALVELVDELHERRGPHHQAGTRRRRVARRRREPCASARPSPHRASSLGSSSEHYVSKGWRPR